MTNKIVIDNKEYIINDDATDEVKAQLANLVFVDEQILQKNNELQVAETAKIGYSRAFARELEKTTDE